jgi:serine/threonine-protein kinase RsbW
MEMEFRLTLPRDALSVPVVRKVLRSSLGALGVVDDTVSDIEIALTEACTNVLDHALDDEEYAVVAKLDDMQCVIDVVDAGVGFDAEGVGTAAADLTAEHGRGIQLIRALTDSVRFTTAAEAGAVVHFEKRLELREGAAIRVLAERAAAADGGTRSLS